MWGCGSDTRVEKRPAIDSSLKWAGRNVPFRDVKYKLDAHLASKTKLSVAVHKVIADNLQDGLTSRAIHAALEDGIKTLRQYSTGDTSSEESDN